MVSVTGNIHPIENFDWDLYENGYNGTNLVINKKVKSKKGDKIYCHEKYANDLYKKLNGEKVPTFIEIKDFTENSASKVSTN